MESTIIQQGAEAKIILSNNFVIKDRIKKSYRIPELDKKIRKKRTRSEAKLLAKASKIINAPEPTIQPFIKNSTKLKIPFIEGKKLSEHLDNFPIKKQEQILNQIGKDVAKLHNENIIHGDLTTSNMILVSPPNKINKSITKKPNSKISSSLTQSSRSALTKSGAKQLIASNSEPIIFFIDFGLGYFNGKYEDKAVDIHLLKQALEAKHFRHWEALFKEFEKAYKSVNKIEAEKVLNQLIKVEKRGRYKG